MYMLYLVLKDEFNRKDKEYTILKIEEILIF